MRVASPALVVCVATALATVPAVSAATLSILDTIVVSIDGVASAPVPFAIRAGEFRESFTFVACDGSVRVVQLNACDGSVLPAEAVNVAFAGSVFPFVGITIFFTDNGAPSSISTFVSIGMPTIVGVADWKLEGELDLDPFRAAPGAVTPAAGDDYFTGWVFGAVAVPVASLGNTPVAPDPLASVFQAFGPVTGTFDCDAIGGCTGFGILTGMTGLGSGQKTRITGRFDVDPAASVAVPIPATGLLLLGGLVGLGALRRHLR